MDTITIIIDSEDDPYAYGFSGNLIQMSKHIVIVGGGINWA